MDTIVEHFSVEDDKKDEQSCEQEYLLKFQDYLRMLNKLLAPIPYAAVKEYVNLHMREESDNLVNAFNEAFEDIELDNPIYIECLKIMGRLGIDIFEKKDYIDDKIA